MVLIVVGTIVGIATVAALSAISAYKEGYVEGWRDGADGVPCNPWRPRSSPDPDLMP